jgi:malonyl-CoA/methylmalonyl-CoA synthetase
VTYEGNFYQHIERHAVAAPDAPCVYTGSSEVLSRQWLHQMSGRYANALLALGCVRGDRVAVQVEKSVQALCVYLACVRAGLVFLPLNTAYQPDELAFLLSDAAPALFVCRPSHKQQLQAQLQLPADVKYMDLDANGQGSLYDLARSCDHHFDTCVVDGEDMACLMYTSGTTGRPKGAMLSHRAMSYCALTLCSLWQFSEADVLLHALPVFHGHGLFVSCNVALAAGAAMLFQPGFNVDAVLTALPQASVFMGVPTYVHRLLADARLTPELCAHMRLFTCGSAPLSAEVHRAFEARTGHRIVERYGATEAMIISSNPMDGERRPGSVGLALPGLEVRITDAQDQALTTGEIGMIQVRGPGLFSGYWRLPQQTQQEFTADGFFRTGDLGCMDDSAYLSITGRAKDLIISGGYNVYPVEVENVINRMPQVQESAVVGVPHPDFGEAVVAVLVPHDMNNAPTKAEVIAWTRERLANYKLPKQVLVLAELPRNTMGKVVKAKLRQWLAQGGGR